MQNVTLHVAALVAVAGAAVGENGEPLALENLSGELLSGDAVRFLTDDDSTDNNSEIATSDVVGAVAEVKFTADGPDGRKFQAEASITLVARDVEIEPMSLTFTEVAA